MQNGRKFERRRLRVYVAGPISKGDVFENVAKGMKWGKKMLRDGLAPYIPHLDAFMLMTDEVSWNAFLEWDAEWVAQAEALFRVAGESKGADLEVELANSLGIPVFFEDGIIADYNDLLLYAELKQLTGVRA